MDPLGSSADHPLEMGPCYPELVILDRLDVSATRFAAETGWSIKPEGACKGEVCVPLTSAGPDDTFDLVGTAERLGMAIVDDPTTGLFAVGPASLGGRALTTAVAPELTLPQVLTGETFRLSSLLGSKVVLVAWAPY